MAKGVVGGKINAEKLVDSVMAELNDYETYVSGVAIKGAVKKTSDEAVRQLRSSSPTRTGQYSQSWTNKEDFRPQRYKYVEIVYSEAPGYRLTHLLENGHKKRGKSGGMVKAYPHIAKVEQKLGDWLVKFLKGELEK